MAMEHTGELAALGTALCWTVTALSFETATKRIGSLSVNLIRLFFAFFFLGIFNIIRRGMFLPVDASSHAWLWLSLSGFVGFVIGDLLLFESYTIIGSRVAMLVMTLVPPITAIIGWLILGEVMTWLHVLGMMLTISGIAMAIFSRGSQHRRLFSLNHPLKGILLAFGGAAGQAVGLVLSKLGMGAYDAFAATHIRIITGVVGFAFVILFLKRYDRVFKAFRNKKGIGATTLGAFFGPFLGVSLSLFAVQHTVTGIASTIMAIVPILIIPPAIFLFRQKVTVREIMGAIISVAGVALFFL